VIADVRPDSPAQPAGASGAFPWLLLAWGLVWAIIGLAALQVIGPSPWPIQGDRAVDLRASLAVLNRGGPLLLKYLPGTHTPYPVGFSDDQGVYVLVPLISHWLGVSDPISVLRDLWLACWSSALLISAALFGAVFRSRWAGLVAPPTLLVCILSFGFGDIYWVSAWVVVMFLPILLLIVRRRPRLDWLALIAIALMCGAVSAIRSEAGLPVVLAAVGAAGTARSRWPWRAAVVVVLVLAYLSINDVALPAIREHRDHVAGVNLSKGTPTSHPFWHTVYIGLGYEPNRYGIHYADAYAAAAAQEEHPGARYLSPAYASALRKEVLAVLKHEPGFVVKSELQKVLVELYHVSHYILLLVLLLPAALVARGPARLRRWEVALFLPAVVYGALPAIAAAPFREYELGLMAPLGALGLLAIGSAAARGDQAWAGSDAGARMAARARATFQTVRRAWPVRVTVRALLIAAVVLIPAALYARHLENEHNQWDMRLQPYPHVVLAERPAGLPTPN
jgi:hypothetical protein